MNSTDKRCYVCGKTKPREAFWRNAAAKDGLQARCILCMKAERAENEDRRRSKPSQFLLHLLTLRQKRLHLSKEYLVSLFADQGGLCALSGLPMTTIRGEGRLPTNASIDRIDGAKGYVPGNIRLVCLQANGARDEWGDEQLLAFCKTVVQYDRKRRRR